MRATRKDEHISGAERLVSEESVANTVSELVKRAQAHQLGTPDEVSITIERVDEKLIRKVSALPIKTIQASDFQEGRKAAMLELIKLGIDRGIAQRAIELLANGASPSHSNMRGAVLMDFRNGKRLEPDKYRGVRVSRMDLVKSAERKLIKRLVAEQIDPNYARDAIVLATKVAHVEGSVAELCWSDDSNYTPGYVASKELGYVRFTQLKPKGCRLGGRIFFIDPREVDIEKYVEILERQPFLVT
jgi:6-carboxyhexanoate--CoA ligase